VDVLLKIGSNSLASFDRACNTKHEISSGLIRHVSVHQTKMAKYLKQIHDCQLNSMNSHLSGNITCDEFWTADYFDQEMLAIIIIFFKRTNNKLWKYSHSECPLHDRITISFMVLPHQALHVDPKYIHVLNITVVIDFYKQC
jgi:hypothetical protein